MIGQVVGNRYEVLEKIGEGGMAIVYKARCNKLNRFVALKILKKELANDEDTVEKFIREATAIATLSDPNIVNVLDVGNQDKLYYIVMEYIKGDTLKKIIKEYGKLNYETTVTVAIQIAKALDCAHKNGIIHRDVKPQNILLTEEGRVKVADFGIAKSETTKTITSTTTIMGSAHYFSPEQAKGNNVDARADLYSLGVVIYEMVTGELPFQADSPVSLALKHIQEEVIPPKQINSKVPESLNNLIVKAMSKEKSNRYQSAKEIILDLQRIKKDPNASVSNSINEEDNNKTIIMAPIKIENSKKVEQEDNEYYDDEDEHKMKKGKAKKVIISLLIAILVITGLVAAGVLLANGGGGGTETKTEVTVPTLKGLTKEEAEESLKTLGLELVDRGTEASDEKEGTIIGVEPKEGMKVKIGSKVNIITSSGGEKLKMQDFKESDLETVKIFLTRNEIDFDITNDYSDEIEEGLVISTKPGKNEEISKETKVLITVSLGRKVKRATVKDVAGLSEGEAKQRLSDFEVEVQYKETVEENQVGIVMSQTNSGKNLEVGSTIRITVGKKAEEKEININEIINTSMTGKEAKAALESKGFKVEVNGGLDDKVYSWENNVAKKGDTIKVTTKKKEPDSDSNNSDNNNDNNNNDNNNNNQ